MRVGILNFADSSQDTAVVRRATLMARGLSYHGYDSCLIFPQKFDDGPMESIKDGLPVNWARPRDGKRSYSSIASRVGARTAVCRLISRLARDGGIDWLLLDDVGVEGLAYACVARRHGVRVATEYSEPRWRPPRLTLTAVAKMGLFSASDRLLPRLSSVNAGASEYQCDRLRRVAPAAATVLVPPLVDTQRFLASAEAGIQFRRRLSIGKSLLLGYFGSYLLVNGLNDLLLSVRALSDAGHNLKLIIAGRPQMGKANTNVGALVRDLRLNDLVVETGWLDTAALIAAMSACDILVMPRANDPVNNIGAPAPTKLAEYAAMGRAIVAAKVGDTPHFMQHERDILYYEAGSQSTLAACVARASADATLRLSLGSNARDVAERSFDYRSAMAVLAAALDSIRNEARRRT